MEFDEPSHCGKRFTIYISQTMTWRQQMRPNLRSHAVRVAWVLFLGELGQAIAHILFPAPSDAVSDRVPKSFPSSDTLLVMPFRW